MHVISNRNLKMKKQWVLVSEEFYLSQPSDVFYPKPFISGCVHRFRNRRQTLRRPYIPMFLWVGGGSFVTKRIVNTHQRKQDTTTIWFRFSKGAETLPLLEIVKATTLQLHKKTRYSCDIHWIWVISLGEINLSFHCN